MLVELASGILSSHIVWGELHCSASWVSIFDDDLPRSTSAASCRMWKDRHTATGKYYYGFWIYIYQNFREIVATHAQWSDRWTAFSTLHKWIQKQNVKQTIVIFSKIVNIQLSCPPKCKQTAMVFFQMYPNVSWTMPMPLWWALPPSKLCALGCQIM